MWTQLRNMNEHIKVVVKGQGINYLRAGLCLFILLDPVVVYCTGLIRISCFAVCLLMNNHSNGGKTISRIRRWNLKTATACINNSQSWWPAVFSLGKQQNAFFCVAWPIVVVDSWPSLFEAICCAVGASFCFREAGTMAVVSSSFCLRLQLARFLLILL